MTTTQLTTTHPTIANAGRPATTRALTSNVGKRLGNFSRALVKMTRIIMDYIATPTGFFPTSAMRWDPTARYFDQDWRR